MTTKPAQIPGVIPYRPTLPDGFKCPDPDEDERRPDSLLESPVINECGHLLRTYFAGRPEVLVDTGGFVFWDRQDMRRRRRPDLYISFGVDSAAIFDRNGYVVWEAGKAPDFALEVASETTHRVDTDEKPAVYAEIGISEYWRFDPTGGEWYGYPIAGDRLVDGAYQPIEIKVEPDGTHRGYSFALALELRAKDRRLTFHDPAAGADLLNLAETQAELAETQDELAEREAELAERNAELSEQTAARRTAEAEAERLREEIRRLRGQ